MSFKLFIYYCALCGAWAAFFVWLVASTSGAMDISSKYKQTALIAALLGLFIGGAVGAVDAALNAKGAQRLGRVFVCLLVGLVGGALSGLIGEFLHSVVHLPKFIAWALVGTVVGASVGVFDLIRVGSAGESSRGAWRKTLNGVIGGLLGGLVGGAIFEVLTRAIGTLEHTSLALGLVILGACIGLLIGLAQVILKEAWLRVEAGFRPGRELMLSKEETTIGRAESCDLGLFGDNAIERTHARILLKNNRYLLDDAGTEGGTFLNDERIEHPTPLRSGDTIRVGNSLLRFGERQKRTE